ncbi:nucleotide-diphospho-sugar transferase [Protomyces lactucae-debilis]|uniref:Nucleotide-diphospho-sugar transferase n=1 Tax=Protomyces lactucae-debilis TaxID=2754530 RepID=A0A1Y2F9E5_PROLT|nr:nucleotide-diphospho-sugar transferase [Protomyces lactucae-debilis]ORY80528.1 nucleotide-diphospho-sugar transferase [Protomyces lactucae-debilis]
MSNPYTSSSRYVRLAISVVAALTVISALCYGFSSDSKVSLTDYWPAAKADAALLPHDPELVDSRPLQPAEQLSWPVTQASKPFSEFSGVATQSLFPRPGAHSVPKGYGRGLIDPLPTIDFTKYKDLPHAHANANERYTYATFLCNHDPDPRHAYLAAVQSLVWRILWSSWSSKKYPMLVLVCPITPHSVRDVLRGQGAIVEELPLLDGPKVEQNVGRWQDMYSKLNIWNLTSWDKIAFLDVDALPVDNIDEVFEVPTQLCNKTKLNADDYQLYRDNPSEAEGYCNYLFAGVEWQDDFLGRPELNAGFLVLKPNRLMHERLLLARYKTDKYPSSHVEQGLLASDEVGFGQKSAFPMHRLSSVYNVGAGVNHDQELVVRAKVLHEKLWYKAMMVHSERNHNTWDIDWMAMCRFYDSPAFHASRKLGFLRMTVIDQNFQFGDVLYLDMLDDQQRTERLESLDRDRKAAQKSPSR